MVLEKVSKVPLLIFDQGNAPPSFPHYYPHAVQGLGRGKGEEKNYTPAANLDFI